MKSAWATLPPANKALHLTAYRLVFQRSCAHNRTFD